MATSASAPGRSQSPRKRASVILEPLLLRAVQAAEVCGASVRTWRTAGPLSSWGSCVATDSEAIRKAPLSLGERVGVRGGW